MAEVKINWDQRELEPFIGGDVERALVRALSKAGGDAIRGTRAESKRQVRGRKRMKAEFLHNRGMPLTYPAKGAKIESLRWTMRVWGKPVALSKYPARQTRKGVSVMVNKGKRRLVKGAFLATMKSGHRGVFMREGDARLPIQHALSSRVSDVFDDKGMPQRVLLRGHTIFGRTFRRVLPLEVEKVRK